ncbi:hypothetical protein MBLNU230_g1836t2 [Neophaeotheca triangularis]
MGFFSRRTSAPDTNTAAAVGGDGKHERPQRTSSRKGRSKAHAGTAAYAGNGILNSRPSFGAWIKGTWLDILTMAILGAVGLGVYQAPPAPSRSFPIYFNNGQIVYPDFAYPMRNEIIPIWAAAMLAALVPIAVFLMMQIRIRSFWDVNNATIGLLYSLICAAVFQVFIKWLIGGLRPHFLAVCKPNAPRPQEGSSPDGNGFGSIMYDKSVCTGDAAEINDSLESMPSGHTTAAFAGFVFLYLYLNAKLKVFSNYHPAMWKLVVTYMPILGAVLIAGALTIDEYHNWYDLVAGATIGTIFAFSSYRMVYASVWDFRFNHIPLVRDLPFTFTPGGPFDSFHDSVFTRKASWGAGDLGSFGGAPFDAAGGLLGGVGAAGGGGVAGASFVGAGSRRNRRASSGEATLGRRSADGYGEPHPARSSVSRKPVPGYPRGENMV